MDSLGDIDMKIDVDIIAQKLQILSLERVITDQQQVINTQNSLITGLLNDVTAL